jgi:two-component system chemotaxis response regulator CheV
VQAFAVEDVREIVQLEWSQIIPSEVAKGSSLVTGIARLDGMSADSRLAQVVDVEQVLSNVLPSRMEDVSREVVGPALVLPQGAVLIAADDSAVARSVIELGLKAMGLPYVMTRTGKEAWDHMEALAAEALAQGTTANQKIGVVLTDLEMPEMDGFTLTRKIKSDPRFNSIPVVIHSSLTGSTNENHVKSVGADAYVAKFAPRELAVALRTVLGQ